MHFYSTVQWLVHCIHNVLILTITLLVITTHLEVNKLLASSRVKEQQQVQSSHSSFKCIGLLLEMKL